MSHNQKRSQRRGPRPATLFSWNTLHPPTSRAFEQWGRQQSDAEAHVNEQLQDSDTQYIEAVPEG